MGSRCSTVHAVKRICQTVSEKMHLDLLAHLISKPEPVSIILDGSTDRVQRHYLSVQFQTTEYNRPIVYQYRYLVRVSCYFDSNCNIHSFKVDSPS